MAIADTSGQDVLLDRKSHTRRTVVVVIVAGIVLSLVAWLALPALQRWSQAEASVARDRLRLATVTRGDLVRDVSVQGRVVAAVSPTLYATQPGTITFQVESGDRVEAGDVLAVIDSPEVSNRLQQEQSSLERLQLELERHAIQSKQDRLQNQKSVDMAKVQLTAADREKRRADQAYGKEAISQLDWEKAHDELLNAELAYKHAVADADLANERLDFEHRAKKLEADRQGLLVADLQRQVDELTMHSPVSGIVGNLLVAQKTAVTRNQPVLSVVDLSQFEVELQVPESYADDLAIGMASQVHVGNEVHDATLVSISPEIIDGQVTARVRFDGEPPQGLRQNQRLTTRVLIESKHDVLTVRRGQFLESGGGHIAYQVVDGMARRRSIEVGARSLNAVEIMDGLQEGDTIVISSTDAFNGAETVMITD